MLKPTIGKDIDVLKYFDIRAATAGGLEIARVQLDDGRWNLALFHPLGLAPMPVVDGASIFASHGYFRWSLTTEDQDMDQDLVGLANPERSLPTPIYNYRPRGLDNEFSYMNSNIKFQGPIVLRFWVELLRDAPFFLEPVVEEEEWVAVGAHIIVNPVEAHE